MIHIDTSTITPLAKWSKKVEELDKKLNACVTAEERGEFIDKHPYWRVFKETLMRVSYGKCWYSEAREIYSHYHVDHFRPKKKALDINDIDQGGYWWLAYDWTNYRLCGSVGNTKKNDYFPVLRHKSNNQADPLSDEIFYFLDPTDPDDVDLLSFDEDGKIKSANPDRIAWNYIRADETIRWFDLNYDELKNERKRVWRRTFNTIKTIQNLLQQLNQSPSVALREQIKAKKEELFQQVAPCAELSATVKCCLRSSGLDWAIRISGRMTDTQVKKYCEDYL